MRRLLFFGATHVHRDLQHHHHAVKAVKTISMTRPSKRRLVGRSDPTEKLDQQLRESLKLRLYCRVKLPGRAAKAKKRVILRFQTVKMKVMRNPISKAGPLPDTGPRLGYTMTLLT